MKQKLAGAVWYQQKGRTLVRELAAEVSNPQTSSQMAQRGRLANLVALYRTNKFWMNHGAFESKKTAWSDYNAFVSANSKSTPIWLTKGAVASGACIVAPVAVTKGTLPSVNLNEYESNSTFSTDLYTGSLFIEDETTAAALSTALLASNNGLQEGDQISVIINYQRSDGAVPGVTARAYEFIIDTQDTRTMVDLGLNAVMASDEIEVGGEYHLVISLDPTGENAGVAVIISREVSGKIYVSSQSLVLTSAQTSYITQYTSDAAFAAMALSYGGDAVTNFLSRGYSAERSADISMRNSILGASVNNGAIRAVGGNALQVADGDMVHVTFANPFSASDVTSLTATAVYAYLGTQEELLTRNIAPSSEVEESGTILLDFGGIESDEAQLSSVTISINGVTYTGSWNLTISGNIQE